MIEVREKADRTTRERTALLRVKLYQRMHLRSVLGTIRVIRAYLPLATHPLDRPGLRRLIPSVTHDQRGVIWFGGRKR